MVTPAEPDEPVRSTAPLTPERLRRSLVILAHMAEAYENRPEGKVTTTDHKHEADLRRVVEILEECDIRQQDHREKLASVELMDALTEVYSYVAGLRTVWTPNGKMERLPRGQVSDAWQREEILRAWEVYRVATTKDDPGPISEAILRDVVLTPQKISGPSGKDGPRVAAAKAVSRLLELGDSGSTMLDRAKKLTRWRLGEPAPEDGDTGNYFGTPNITCPTNVNTTDAGMVTAPWQK